MGKGIVKSIKQKGTITPVQTTTTVAYATESASRDITYESTIGEPMEGSIQDTQDPTREIEFFQPFGMELGINVGTKVQYNTILVNGKPVINMVRLVEKGCIETINASNDGGTMLDKSTGRIIPFAHLFCKESGLIPTSGTTRGSIVSFERVIDPKTAEITATALELIK